MRISFNIERVREVVSFRPFDTTSEYGRSKERYRRILLTSSSSIIGKVISALIGLISVPLTINYMGKEQYGLWMIITSLIAWMQLSDLGINNGLTNALSEANGKDDIIAAQSYISTALFTCLIIAGIISIPVIVLSFILPWDSILNIHSTEFSTITGLCILISGLIFVVNFPLSVVNRIFIAYQLGYISNIVQVMVSIINLLGLLIAIYLKLGLPWLVLLFSLGPLISNCFLWTILPHKLQWCQIDRRLISRTALNRVFNSSIPLFLLQFGGLLANELVNVELAHLSGLKIVADYNVLMKIYLLIFMLGAGLSSSFFPAIREAYERKEYNWVLKSINKVLLIRIGALLISSLPLLFIGNWLVGKWLHQPIDMRFGLIGWASLIACLVLSATSSTFADILSVLDDIWSQIKIVFLSATIILSGIYFLTPILGVTGVYVSFSLSAVYPIIWGFRKLQRKVFLQSN